MIQTLPLPLRTDKSQRMALAFFLAYAVIMALSLHAYLAWQSLPVIMGVLALPLVTTLQPGYGKKRYGIVAAMMAMVTMLLPVNTLLYFTLAFACLFITESFLGRINWLPVCMIFLLSPVFQFAANVFSFPVRLELTSWAGHIMNAVTGHVTVEGNMIICKGNEFSVDPACMGLNMIVTSLLLQLVVMAMYQRKFKLRLMWWQVTGLLAITFTLNVISNLFRIISLVWFNILPGTYMHDLVGIGCLILYVIVPVLWLTQLVIRYKGRAVTLQADKTTSLSWKRLVAIHLLLLLLVCWSAYTVIRKVKAINDTSETVAAVDGYMTTRITTEIVKLQNSESLIYIKHIPGFYNADHHPMICWKGSGYLFKQVKLETIGKQQVYTALLQNGKDQLYTAWWYDNGIQRTIDQLRWRTQMLSGARSYSVVNITTSNKQQLIREIKDLFSDNSLKPLL
ncbi:MULTISPECIES: exosortase N [Niastella]|uniref:Exosortase N n=1 Tax=Niastella soli TaxID=2821487 RepID=A0ABS3YND5_9BACT|nr:exosortase N [Niastella soli]MBO9199107.1 exosortase N [Niastella soli]